MEITIELGKEVIFTIATMAIVNECLQHRKCTQHSQNLEFQLVRVKNINVVQRSNMPTQKEQLTPFPTAILKKSSLARNNR